MKTSCAAAVKRLRGNAGMTLTEMLVAMAVLMIAIMCFLPLAQSSYNNIHTVGEKTKSNYKSIGLIERLIGNTGANGDYEVSTADVPLKMRAGSVAIQANSSSLQSIDGVSITSTPENAEAGFTTFICDSVTAKMVCYPSHISDDFRTKTITLYASGFRFSSINEFEIYYTDSSGNLQVVPGTYNDTNPYCRLKIDKDNASIVSLTLVGDNNVICFENSPLVIKYRVYELTVEIDAPTVIMVGEQAADGNYYYYVTSGELDEDGNLDIIRKKMNSVDPLGKLSGNVTLTSAMNDVEWVAAGEGDDGQGGTNEYGYYVMCGDNGQIRRFWKNPTTGNYGWGGDWTIAHEYYYNNGSVTTTDKQVYDTTVDSSYVYVQDPKLANGICLLENHTFDDYQSKFDIWDSVYTQTVFTINALEKHPDIEVYTAGDSLYIRNAGTDSSSKSYY
ncbi:MAG: prepilin-type N-terminal cleavage/methylation domain-containing protein, partial [Candidatus Fimenecus sp.]